MTVVVSRGQPRRAILRVPGDKSIAHRWLILAATGSGRTVLRDLPRSLDVRSTASCLAQLAPSARPGLEALTRELGEPGEGNGSTWNEGEGPHAVGVVEVEGEGRSGLAQPRAALDCGNSGTTMRLLCGVLAGARLDVVLLGDESLSRRPMERVAEPLRLMGAEVLTTSGRPPLTIRGGPLSGIQYPLPVPSAQVKGAVLLAGCCASGVTSVSQPARLRDHTERALEALGARVFLENDTIELHGPFDHAGFEAAVPGRPSSAASLVAAAAA